MTYSEPDLPAPWPVPQRDALSHVDLGLTVLRYSPANLRRLYNFGLPGVNWARGVAFMRAASRG